jgi:hypothetical protein
MNQLIMYVPLTNYSSCQISEDAHEYIMGLKKCLLDELEQSEEGSGVAVSGIAYDENLHMSMKIFGTYSAQESPHRRLYAQHVAQLLIVSNHSVN